MSISNSKGGGKSSSKDSKRGSRGQAYDFYLSEQVIPNANSKASFGTIGSGGVGSEKYGGGETT